MEVVEPIFHRRDAEIGPYDKPVSLKKLCGYGYQNGLLSDLEYYVEEYGATIVDIRRKPEDSHHPFFQKSTLEEHLRQYYWHEHNFANLLGSNPGDPVSIMDIEQGMEYLERWIIYRPMILLCKCSDYTQCHRKMIFEEMEWRNPEIEIVHLTKGMRVEL